MSHARNNELTKNGMQTTKCTLSHFHVEDSCLDAQKLGLKIKFQLDHLYFMTLLTINLNEKVFYVIINSGLILLQRGIIPTVCYHRPDGRTNKWPTKFLTTTWYGFMTLITFSKMLNFL